MIFFSFRNSSIEIFFCSISGNCPFEFSFLNFFFFLNFLIQKRTKKRHHPNKKNVPLIYSFQSSSQYELLHFIQRIFIQSIKWLIEKGSVSIIYFCILNKPIQFHLGNRISKNSVFQNRSKNQILPNSVIHKIKLRNNLLVGLCFHGEEENPCLLFCHNLEKFYF